MTLRRITVRIERSLQEQLQALANTTGRALSEVVRQALEEYLRQRTPPRTCYDVAKEAGVIGCVKGGPRDMSTNRKRMKGFGRR